MLARELSSDVPGYYTDEDYDTMLNKDNSDVLFEDNFIASVFNSEPCLEKAQWIKNV